MLEGSYSQLAPGAETLGGRNRERKGKCRAGLEVQGDAIYRE